MLAAIASAVALDVELIEGSIQCKLILLMGEPLDWPGLNVALKVGRKLALHSVHVAIHPEAAAKVMGVALIQRSRVMAQIHRKVVLLQRLMSRHLAVMSCNRIASTILCFMYGMSFYHLAYVFAAIA